MFIANFSTLRILIFLALSLTFTTWAKPISYEKALHVAEKAIKGKKLKFKHKSPQKLLYIFQNEENKGFVIVAGDDVFKPIIGYSENGTYDSLNMPPSFAWYLENIEKEMTFALNNESISMAANDSYDSDYIAGTYLLTTTWAQIAPYNNQTPVIDGKQTLAGCIATAMAQIMKYHEHPSGALTGIIPAYATRTKKLAIPSVNLANVEFDFANMKNSYGTSYTSAEANAVATLMNIVGKSVKMDYDVNGSGAAPADVAGALRDYFGYSSNMKYVLKTSFNGDWIAMLKEQINSNLPVLYGGNGSDGAHAFVLDGYDNSNNFHINWGWGGPYDGFYALTLLNPENYNFNATQHAVINIKPVYNTYTISFDLNGGSGTVPANITGLIPGSTLSAEQKPSTDGFTKSGYVNDGKWYMRTVSNVRDTAVTTTIYTESFENNGGGWYLGEGSEQTNKWVRMGNLYNTGRYSLAISSGTGNTYNTSVSSVDHIYRDITFPASGSDFYLTFYFKGSGEANHDYMTVRYIDIGANLKPTNGSVFDIATQIGTDYFNNSRWTQKTITLPAEIFSGKTMRLILSWINNNSGGTQPPAAVDDIKITTLMPQNIYTYNYDEFKFGFGDGTAVTANTKLYLQWTLKQNVTPIFSNKEILLSNLLPNKRIEVYNLQGKLIYSTNSGNSQSLKIPVQTKGVYVVKINDLP